MCCDACQRKRGTVVFSIGVSYPGIPTDSGASRVEARFTPASRPSSAPPRLALGADGLRDSQPYREPDIGYQQLVTERYAPRWLRDLKRYGWLPQN